MGCDVLDVDINYMNLDKNDVLEAGIYDMADVFDSIVFMHHFLYHTEYSLYNSVSSNIQCVLFIIKPLFHLFDTIYQIICCCTNNH